MLIDLSFFILFSFDPVALIEHFFTFFAKTEELPISLPIVIFELSFIDLLILPNIDAKTFFFIESVVPFINFFIVLPDAVTMSHPLLEITLVYTLVFPIVLTIAVSYAVDVLTCVKTWLPMYLSPLEKVYCPKPNLRPLRKFPS
jgi:hypothetical protein